MALSSDNEILDRVKILEANVTSLRTELVSKSFSAPLLMMICHYRIRIFAVFRFILSAADYLHKVESSTRIITNLLSWLIPRPQFENQGVVRRPWRSTKG